MCAAAKAAVPTIGDQAAQISVSNATRQMALTLAELRTCCTNTEQVCEITSASVHVKVIIHFRLSAYTTFDLVMSSSSEF